MLKTLQSYLTLTRQSLRLISHFYEAGRLSSTLMMSPQNKNEAPFASGTNERNFPTFSDVLVIVTERSYLPWQVLGLTGS